MPGIHYVDFPPRDIDRSKMDKDADAYFRRILRENYTKESEEPKPMKPLSKGGRNYSR